MRRIAVIYVHHDGGGHLRRAVAIGSQLRARGWRVTLIGSALPEHLAGAWPMVHVPSDAEEPAHDPTANGVLHWAPLGRHAFGARMSMIADRFVHERPSVVVVDVSVEVSVLVRLLGIPVVVVRQPGERDDPAHALAFGLATRVLAPWPRELLDPAITTSGTDGRTVFTGGISMMAGPRGDAEVDPHVGCVLWAGEPAPEQLVRALRADLPDMQWTVVDATRRIEDLQPLLRRARVAITHAGLGSLADLATVGVPAIAVARERHHAEQAETVRGLRRLGWARVLDASGPEPDWSAVDWAQLVGAAVRTGSLHPHWRTEGAAARAADVIEDAAREGVS